MQVDPKLATIREQNEAATPLPTTLAPRSTTLLFSPRANDDALNVYTELLTRAQSSVCFTAAFGVNAHFAQAMSSQTASADDAGGVVRYVLLEKSDYQTKALEKNDPLTKVAVGSVLDEKAASLLGVLPEQARDTLLESLFVLNAPALQVTGLNDHVSYIHTKYLLVDPFSADPIVVCGSANFSKASNLNNDENMMIVRGDTRLADQVR